MHRRLLRPSRRPSAPRHPRAARPLLPRRRGVVTSSVPPSPAAFIERPEVVVLAESALYGRSWCDALSADFPRMVRACVRGARTARDGAFVRPSRPRRAPPNVASLLLPNTHLDR